VCLCACVLVGLRSRFSIHNNSLTGTVPPALNAFGATAFDLNCFNNASYALQSWWVVGLFFTFVCRVTGHWSTHPSIFHAFRKMQLLALAAASRHAQVCTRHTPINQRHPGHPRCDGGVAARDQPHPSRHLLLHPGQRARGSHPSRQRHQRHHPLPAPGRGHLLRVCRAVRERVWAVGPLRAYGACGAVVTVPVPLHVALCITQWQPNAVAVSQVVGCVVLLA
jgi:hypothetical protein